MIEPLSKLFKDPSRVRSVMVTWSEDQANATDGKVPAWSSDDVDSILQGTLTPLEVSPSLLISLADSKNNPDPKLFCKELLGDMFTPKARSGGSNVVKSQVS